MNVAGPLFPVLVVIEIAGKERWEGSAYLQNFWNPPSEKWLTSIWAK